MFVDLTCFFLTTVCRYTNPPLRNNFVKRVMFSSSGGHLLSVSNDGVVRVFDGFNDDDNGNSVGSRLTVSTGWS